jgi:hypothetical protein
VIRRSTWPAALLTALAACGTPSKPHDCPVGQSCVSDVYVACFATDDVRGLTSALQPSATNQPVGDGPISLALRGADVWVSHSLGAPEVDVIVNGGAPAKHVLASGGDLEYLKVHGDRVYVSNATLGTVTVLDAASGATVDEVSMAVNAGDFVNPRGIDFVGSRAYVALPGSSDSSASFAVAQQVAIVDFSTAQGQVVKRISMDAPNAFDSPGLPFPYRLVAVGTKVYVALANLKLAASQFGSFYTDPAGNGRLAVIDSGAGDAVSIVDLGAGCQNPSSLTADGDVLWIACSSSGAVLPVALATSGPTLGAPIALPAGVVPGNVAVCGANGYVTDQFSGQVVRFDTASRAVVGSAAVCPLDATTGFALAADVACVP